MADDGARWADAAMAAAQRGNFVEAAASFERAAEAHVAANNPGAAFAAHSNLAMVKKLVGDLRGALGAVDRALALPADKQSQTLAMMTRAAILDALDDREAITAWMSVATQHDDLAAASFALAHCSGATLKHGAPSAWANGRKIVDEAASVPMSQLIGIVGGFGESAGAAGVPALAQAVLLMQRHMAAFNPATAPFWDLLVERIGPGSPLALALCSFGLILTSMKNGTPEHPVLMSRVGAVLDRVARARFVSIDDVLTAIERDPAMYSTIEPALQALISPDQWIVKL